MSEALDQLMSSIGQKYPGLQPHLPNVVAQRGQANDGRMLEFYPPWETDNPNPNKTTLELYDPALKSPHLESLMAGDLLHLLGSIDPRSNKPVDPRFLDMKKGLINAMGPEQNEMNRRAYERDKPFYQKMPSFDDWMQHSRADAYIRGGVFPEANPDWQQPGTFTRDQDSLINLMRSHLTGNPAYD